MNINGYNPYKKGFDMLVADIQEHEALDELAKQCWSFDHMSFDHVSFARSVMRAQAEEIERLRVIEAAAVACSEYPVWNDDQFYGLMIELQRALRGEVGADETATEGHNADVTGLAPEQEETK